MDEAAIALTAALGAAFLTAAGSIGVIWYQDILRSRSGDSDALAAVVVALLSRSFALAMRAHTIGEMAKVRSGLGEGIDVLTHQRKPIDLLEIHDWLEQDFGPLRAAWSELWSRGDQELVDAGNKLMLASAEVVNAATGEMPAPARFGAKVRRFVRGDEWTPEMTEELDSAERALGDARKDFTLLARRKLGRPVIDPFTRDDLTT